MATTIVTEYNGTAALGSNIFVQIRNAATGSVLVARTHTGIRQDFTPSGDYTYTATGLIDLPWYKATWDENDGLYYSEVIPAPGSGGSGGGSTTYTVLAATTPASINPLVFTIKRGDTDPAIIAQALYQNPANPGNMIPWPIPDASTVKFTMRDSVDFASRTRTAFTVATPKVHATADIIDQANGIMSYGWAAGDTDTDGLFRAEFEVTSGSEIRTFPVGTDDTRNWIAVTIVDDLDPGINP